MDSEASVGVREGITAGRVRPSPHPTEAVSAASRHSWIAWNATRRDGGRSDEAANATRSAAIGPQAVPGAARRPLHRFVLPFIMSTRILQEAKNDVPAFGWQIKVICQEPNKKTVGLEFLILRESRDQAASPRH